MAETPDYSKHLSLFNLLDDAVIAADSGYQVVFWNRVAEKLYGIPSSEAIGKSIKELILVEESPVSREEIRKVVQAVGVWQGEAVHIMRDGKRICVDWNIKVLELPEFGKCGTISIARDITKRKRAEKALIMREHYYRTLMHSMHEDILVIDKDFRVSDINNTFLTTIGCGREEVLGKHCYEILHAYDSPCSEHGEQCVLKEVFETGEPGQCLHEHKKKDGTLAFVEIILSPMKDEKGNVTHVVEAMHDI